MRAERDRLLKMIETDREEINEGSSALAQKEFLRVAEEFFETSGGSRLTVKKEGRELCVTFTVRAKRVKNLTSL